MLHTNDITNTLNQSQKINLDEILNDYNLDLSLFTDIDDRLLDIADNWNGLKMPDKIIMILYAEFGSLRKVADILGFSHTTVNKYIKEIRERLLC